ncbi:MULTISPECIES: class I SAM-dependent methyltransferase [unclassified Mesorhizobium]|uniref:methyltransferase domain-containing protein n=1 Tax=unclassified Mesorhizobium TaxID=325217 RepID=UPI000F758372|nr:MULTISPECIES: class I SAM-dependent methyltransferase [unclassified Mesorhizobium]AZO55834.1 class I SAM-dependent methyltransferase [Mesorhizobium sp. M8A.F.Ca.ET.057.01.1.1]RWE46366.1 MAG: class I SAM-dependent methyltransferase [Mesorhizobium sp.]
MFETSIPATFENFDEDGYLQANPDVAVAVKAGRLTSGRYHFKIIGHTESRRIVQTVAIVEARKSKLSRIINLLKWDEPPPRLSNGGFNCLPDDLAKMAGVVPTDSISQHDYIDLIKEKIEKNGDKLFLDAGAGFRPAYYGNVVNLEIVPYATTDVLAVLEKIPFQDESFDYVISNAVLEHVRDPFAAAREMTRVLKPGGEMFVHVPFLQPYHGYPHHYYNMTKDGLQSLFDPGMEVLSHTVPFYFHPVWVASWFFNSWSNGLSPKTKEIFERMTVKELMSFNVNDMEEPFVRELSENKQFELASGTFLIARKR